jgi:translation elongation factor EF-Tu-like GTPase
LAGKRGYADAVIWIIGHSGHGKTTLMAAIARRRSEPDAAPTGPFVEIEGASAGQTGAETAIVVVSGAEGPMPQTRDHLNLAKRSGVSRVMVFVNKADVADGDLLPLIEMEMRELLNLCGFAGNKAVVIRGSAAKALAGDESEIGEPSIQRLMKALGSGGSSDASSGGGFFRRLFGSP